jgi:hypothetical protein
MLNDSLNTSPTNLVYLVLRKMPKETYNLHKQQNQPKALVKNENLFYNQDVNGTNNGNFTKNVKMTLSKTNSSHQRNHSFSEIFLK